MKTLDEKLIPIGRRLQRGGLAVYKHKNMQKDLHKKDPDYELSLIFEGIESLYKIN